MGWQISQRTNKKGEKQYRLWTTVSDGWLTPWLSRKDMLTEIIQEAAGDYRVKAIEYYYRFPHHFGNYDNKKAVSIIVDDEAMNNYKKWMEKLLSAPNDKYWEMIEKEYNRIMKELDA